MKTAEQELADVNHVLNRALSVCRSAKAIAKREGRDTNWPAFLKGINAVLNAANTLGLPEAVRDDFESWVRETAFFAHFEGEELTRDGLGYEDAAVHGAWLGYLRNRVPQPAPAPDAYPIYSLLPPAPCFKKD